MSKKILFLIFVFAACTKMFAQDEVLTDLQINPVIANAWLKYKYSPSFKIAATGTNYLSLPFIDDFSKASPYPDTSKWADKKVYINRSYPRAPVSIGVATFDGIDSTGYPYNFAASASSSNISDYLTSKLIRLDSVGTQKLTPADSIYLSFYYQAAGRGDAPEPRDSLVLEFKNSLGWFHAWTAEGYVPTTGDSNFYRVLIPITDASYFNKNFQFRFKNYATISGNVDHWHVDYVYLNKGRNKNDTLMQDVAFAYNPSSFVVGLQAIPYEQGAAFKDSVKIFVRNNYNTSLTSSFHYEVDSASIIKYTSGTKSSSIIPYASSGFDYSLAKSKPNAEYIFPGKINIINTDTSSYLCKYYLNTSGDLIPSNDTVIFRQKFYNYFAYDDGSAEAGYGLSTIGAKLAYKFYLSRPDTFRGAEIFFNPVIVNTSGFSFRLVLWSDNGGIPGNILYKDSAVFPVYEKGEYNKFHTYKFTSGVIVSPGTYYIGWIQSTANILNIGFDKNINNQNNIFFDSGSGWNNTINKGSLMLRPLLGKSLSTNVSVNDLERNQNGLVIYPNPANDILTIDRGSYSQIPAKITVLDEIGNEVMNLENFNSTQINISSLANGLYFIRLTDKANVITKRLVVAR